MTVGFRWWLNVLFSAALLSVVILAGLTYRNTLAGHESERAVARSLEVRGLIDQLHLSLYQAETGQRGYLLTNDSTYLDPYRGSLDRTRVLLAKLRSQLRNRPDQTKRINNVEALIERRHEKLAETIQLAQSDETGEGLQAAREAIIKNNGSALMAEIRSGVAEFIDVEEKRIAELVAAADRRVEVSTTSIIFGNAVAISLIVATAWVIRIDRQKRRQAEASLIAEEDRLNAILDAALVGVLAIDSRLRIVFANPAALSILGCRRPELIGESFLRFVPEHGRDQVHATLNSFFEERVVRHQFTRTHNLRIDGQTFLSEGSVSKATPASGPLLTVMFRDVTDEQKSQERAREQAAVLDQVRDAVHLRGLDGRITYWNRGSQLLYGWTAEEAIGRRPEELMSPPARPEDDLADRAVRTNGAWVGEVRQLALDGREIVVEQRRTMLSNERGEPTGVLVINSDITDRKRLEQQERRNQRLESVGTLAGGIAHDLNNVLTPIMMASKLLKRQPAPEQQSQLLDTIYQSAARGAEMIHQVLAFAGGKHTERTSVDITRILAEVQNILRHTLPKQINLVVESTPDLCRVTGDPTELSQVLMNLAINARDAMPEGGTLTIRAEDFPVERVRPTLTRDLEPGRYVLISVGDTGVGIAPDVMERMFDPFFTTKPQGKGTGLGLATSLGIVRSHRGAMGVYTEVKHGTTFCVYLPVETSPQTAPEREEDQLTPIGRGETILVVDDETALLDVTRCALESTGYHVRSASDGQAALAMFGSDHEAIDLALVDMMMPGMDGPATMSALRSIKPALPIIATSGLRRPDEVDRTMPAVQGFISKPYSDDQLLRAIRRVLDAAGHAERERQPAKSTTEVELP